MFSQEKINKLLKEGRDSPLESALRNELNKFMKASSTKMQNYWANWENAQAKYAGVQPKDEDDKNSRAAGEPEKVLIPVTFAQVQTAACFLAGTFSQKERLYELKGQGPEDSKFTDALEVDLDYQVRKDKMLLKQYMFFVDVLKYGFGVMKVTWEERKCLMRIAKQVPQTSPIGKLAAMFGMPAETTMKMEEAVEEVLQYEGNVLTNIAPYCFFPDPGLPVARFQEGSFVGHEELVSRASLISKEGKLYYGTKHIKNFSKGSPEFDQRPRWFQQDFDPMSENRDERNSVIFTEIQFTLVPKEWNEKFKDAEISFGDEEVPVKFVACIANDDKVIRFERLNYLHGEYTYVIGEYLPDHTQHVSMGMADKIDELQQLQTWFINSHIANVKKVIRNQVVVDPSKVHTEDFTNGNTVVRLKGGATTDMDKVFRQLAVSDVTKGHVADADNLMSMIQLVTGVNDNALGAYSGGRRSAYEARQVNTGAALRLKLHGSVLWHQALEPLGQQMLANTRQSRSAETYNKIVGARAQEAPFEQTILADPNSIAGAYDFVPFDGTLPSEKQQFANQLSEILTTVLGNPNAQALGLDPNKLLKKVAELYGMNNLGDFKMDAMPMPQGIPPAPAQGGLPPEQPQLPPQIPQAGPTGAPAGATEMLQQLGGGQ